MALSAFDDKRTPPEARELAAALGTGRELWDGLIDHLAEQYPPIVERWVFSGKKWGWALGVKQKKRSILYMTPSTGFFYVGFALGEKAVGAAFKAGLPEAVVTVIENAPKYAEGRGVRLEVRTDTDLESVRQLAAIKMHQ